MNVVLSNWRCTVFLIFVLALSTRCAFISTQQDGFYFPDSLEDSKTAIRLLSAGEFGADFGRAPGYPGFLAAVYLLFGQNIFVVRLVESFMGALLAVIIAMLGRRVDGEIVGVLGGVIWAVYPMGIFVAGLVYPTGLATMLLACGVWCVLPARHEALSAKKVFSGGFFFGLGALTVPVALVTIVVVAAWVSYWARHSRVFLAAVFFLGSAVSIAPWTARNFLVYGELVPIQAHFEQHFPKIVVPENDESNNRVNAIFLRPDLYAVRFWNNFRGFWELYPSRIAMDNQDYRAKLHAKDAQIVTETIYRPNRLINTISILSVGPIFVFGILGTAAMWPRRDLRRELSMLWIMVLSFAIGYAFFVGKIRYRVPVEPYLIILSACGIHAANTMILARFKSTRYLGDRSFPIDLHDRG